MRGLELRFVQAGNEWINIEHISTMTDEVNPATGGAMTRITMLNGREIEVPDFGAEESLKRLQRLVAGGGDD